MLAREIRSVVETSSLPSFRYKNGDTIVDCGEFVEAGATHYTYTAVPLSIIRSGAVVILEDGKAIKHLYEGDFFGLFETAYALHFAKKKRMGRWTLKADGETEITPLPKTVFARHQHLQNDILIETIQNNAPKPMTRLALLDTFAAVHNIQPMENAVLVFHSHILESTVDLLKHLAFMFGYHNTFVLEKPYSTIDSAFQKVVQMGVHTYAVKLDENMPYEFSLKRSGDFLWDAVTQHVRKNNIDTIIVLSDGADVLLGIPWDKLGTIRVVGVEQTQRGLNRILDLGARIPAVINVAESQAKKQYESPFIARAVCEKIKIIGLLDTHGTFGVIGAGAIGNLVAKHLREAHKHVLQYDKNTIAKTAWNCRSLEEIVSKSDVIVGTTGTDALRGLFIENLRGTKTLLSAGSSNVEFAYVFDLAKRYANRFEDITLPVNEHLQFQVLNGGYPINFDREKEWELSEDIQLTRTLLLAGIVQAIETKRPERGAIIQLRPDWEDEVLSLWQRMKKKKETV